MTLAQDSGGSARETVAEEVRSLMGRHKVSGNRLAVMTGMTQSSMSRRLAGTYPFTVDELEVIADAFGVPITSLFGVRHQGLEPRTRWYGVTAGSEGDATVLQFPAGRSGKPLKGRAGRPVSRLRRIS
jgi:transcriptional regulator with XRE-family HTH domain